MHLWFRTFILKRLGLGSPKLVCKFIWRYLDQDILLGSKGQRSRSQGSKVDFVTFWQLSYCMQIIGARIIKVGFQVYLVSTITAIHFRDQKVKGQGHRGQTFIFHILSQLSMTNLPVWPWMVHSATIILAACNFGVFSDLKVPEGVDQHLYRVRPVQLVSGSWKYFSPPVICDSPERRVLKRGLCICQYIRPSVHSNIWPYTYIAKVPGPIQSKLGTITLWGGGRLTMTTMS